jgi:hypothetical protein
MTPRALVIPAQAGIHLSIYWIPDKPLAFRNDNIKTHIPHYVIPAQAGIHLQKRFIEVVPLWITAFNKVDFPLSLPVFYGFFSRDSGIHCFMQFIPDEVMNVIFTSKSFDKVLFMLPDSLH